MPKSRNRPRPKPPAPSARRRDWRRAAGGWADYARNLSLIFFVAPFLEPLLSGEPIRLDMAAYGTLIALALFALATIFDMERAD